MQITGTGIGSHLGTVTITGQERPGAPGAVTWTAANGDEISIVSMSVMGPIGTDASAPIEFYALAVSGTGRFEHVQLGDGPLAGTIWFFDPYGLSGHLETDQQHDHLRRIRSEQLRTISLTHGPVTRTRVAGPVGELPGGSARDRALLLARG